MAESINIKQFKLDVFRGKEVSDSPEKSYSGTGHDWMSYRCIYLEGFDGRVTLNLELFWKKVIANKLDVFTQTLLGYETIIKFGETMQLKEAFTAQAEVSYSDE